MEHDRQMSLKAEAEKVAARKKLSEVQRGALHAQMQERESLKREVRINGNMAAVPWLVLTNGTSCEVLHRSSGEHPVLVHFS